jgi:hypothetical protein
LKDQIKILLFSRTKLIQSLVLPLLLARSLLLIKRLETSKAQGIVWFQIDPRVSKNPPSDSKIGNKEGHRVGEAVMVTERKTMIRK